MTTTTTIKELRAELAAAPPWKRGTEWESDRLNELAYLERQDAREVLEDDPSDPDNGDPSSWPAWTEGIAYGTAATSHRRTRR